MGLFDWLFADDDDVPVRSLPLGDFEVLLDHVGPRKIAVIKALRDLAEMSLAEAKRCVDAAPTVVTRVATPEAAQEAVARHQDAGAMARSVITGTSSVQRVRLVAPGPRVIHVIKILRETLGIGLRQAKGMVDGAPMMLGPYREEKALQVLMALTKAGATVELEAVPAR
ncbi:MAG: ribosomal protein L7/L12 [Myxococcota bacterium]